VATLITHSKVNSNIMAEDAGNVPQLQANITSHTVCRMPVQDDVLHAVATNSIWINLMIVITLNTALF